MPRFKLTSEFSLGDALSTLGMPLAFSDKADFSGMASQKPLSIGAVIHKAFVEVNEEGTEAAAATAVPMRIQSMPNAYAAMFRADHPFVFLICERKTRSILFFGRVVNPRGSETETN